MPTYTYTPTCQHIHAHMHIHPSLARAPRCEGRAHWPSRCTTGWPKEFAEPAPCTLHPAQPPPAPPGRQPTSGHAQPPSGRGRAWDQGPAASGQRPGASVRGATWHQQSLHSGWQSGWPASNALRGAGVGRGSTQVRGPARTTSHTNKRPLPAGGARGARSGQIGRGRSRSRGAPGHGKRRATATQTLDAILAR